MTVDDEDVEAVAGCEIADVVAPRGTDGWMEPLRGMKHMSGMLGLAKVLIIDTHVVKQLKKQLHKVGVSVSPES